MEVLINKENLISIMTLGKKVLEIEEITGFIKDGYLEINELSKYHDLLINAKYPIYSDVNEKHIRFNCNELNEIKKIKDRSIRIHFNECEAKDKIGITTNFENLNKFSMSVEELSDLIKISDVIACLNLKITEKSIEIKEGRIKVIRELSLNEVKQSDCEVYLDCNVLSRVNEILRDFIDETVEVYFGKQDPVLFKIIGRKNLEVYVPPIPEKEYL